MNILANSGKKSKNGTMWTKYHQACCDIFPQRNPRFESSESLLERAEVIRKWMRMIIKQNPLKKDQKFAVVCHSMIIAALTAKALDSKTNTGFGEHTWLQNC